MNPFQPWNTEQPASRQSWTQMRFEDQLMRGIAAAKAGQREEARRFLDAALRINDMDARPWLWLTATTDDLDERRDYLENALARDPLNQTARRGLAALTNQQIPTQVTGASLARPAPDAPVAGTGRTFTCPNCGGLMRYDIKLQGNRCERCDTFTPLEQINAASDRNERSLDLILSSERAHLWAAAEHTLDCTLCGAMNVLPAGTRTGVCAFCGSDHLVSSQHTEELIEPQTIIPMQVDDEDAYRHARRWLKGGLLAPGDLARKANNLKLRAVYYPAWTFDATFCVRWRAMVEVGAGDIERWEPRDGELFQFFDDVLVPGTKQIKPEELQTVEPFDLKQQVEFREEFLVGWTALLYDQSLADASIAARGVMMEKARNDLEDKAMLMYNEYKDFTLLPQGLIDPTYRQLMLPLWVGRYDYEDKSYTVLVNGQTGKAGGIKPKDPTKVTLLVILGVVAVVAVLVLLYAALLTGTEDMTPIERIFFFFRLGRAVR